MICSSVGVVTHYQAPIPRNDCGFALFPPDYHITFFFLRQGAQVFHTDTRYYGDGGRSDVSRCSRQKTGCSSPRCRSVIRAENSSARPQLRSIPSLSMWFSHVSGGRYLKSTGSWWNAGSRTSRLYTQACVFPCFPIWNMCLILVWSLSHLHYSCN